jgi:hypothetical protein
MNVALDEPLEMYGIQGKENRIILHGTREALDRLGLALESGRKVNFRLEMPPNKASGGQPINRVSFRPTVPDDDAVILSHGKGRLTIEGGRNKAALLGGSLRNLSRAPLRVTPESVPTHADIAYYDTHDFLAPSDTWLTAFVHDQLTGG